MHHLSIKNVLPNGFLEVQPYITQEDLEMGKARANSASVGFIRLISMISIVQMDFIIV